MSKRLVIIVGLITVVSFIVFVIVLVNTNKYVDEIVTYVQSNNEVGDYDQYEIDQTFKTESGELYIVFGREIYDEEDTILYFVGSIGTNENATVAYTTNVMNEGVYNGLYELRHEFKEIDVWTNVRVTSLVKTSSLVICVFTTIYITYGYIKIKKDNI